MLIRHSMGTLCRAMPLKVEVIKQSSIIHIFCGKYDVDNNDYVTFVLVATYAYNNFNLTTTTRN